MKKTVFKFATAIFTLSAITACQSEAEHGHSHDEASAPAQPVVVATAATPASASAPEMNTRIRSDEMKITLAPNQGTEVKMLMTKAMRVNYSWATDGSPVNHDTHGEAPGVKTAHRYSKAVQVTSDKGELVAAFDGEHGWFWRNRADKDVTITLKVDGQYQDIKQKK